MADVREATAAELAELQARITQRVADAEREDVRAYNAALAAGWTADELRRIGVAELDKKSRVRNRAARRSTAESTRQAAAAAGSFDDKRQRVDEPEQHPHPVAM